MAVRWCGSLPLSAAQVVRLLAERNIDVTVRTVLNGVQTFGPQLAAAFRQYRRRVGRTWTVDEVFCFRGTQKLYLYRVVDEHGQVIDVLLRDKRDRPSAEASFRQTLARQVRTGLHRCRGYTTQPVERSHVPTRDRLRGAQGLRTIGTGQRFLESFEALHALRRGAVKLRALVPRYQPTQASEHETVRVVIVVLAVLGTQLRKAA